MSVPKHWRCSQTQAWLRAWYTANVLANRD